MARPELDRFTRLYRLADKLIADASKEHVAEAARILALDLAQYQAKYGELPASEYVSLAAVDSLTPELAANPGRRDGEPGRRAGESNEPRSG